MSWDYRNYPDGKPLRMKLIMRVINGKIYGFKDDKFFRTLNCNKESLNEYNKSGPSYKIYFIGVLKFHNIEINKFTEKVTKNEEKDISKFSDPLEKNLSPIQITANTLH